MIVFLIQRPKALVMNSKTFKNFTKYKHSFSCLTILLGLFPLPSFAYTIEVAPKSIQGDQVTLKVKVLDDQRVPIQGLTSDNLSIQTQRIDQRMFSKNSVNPQSVNFLPPNRTEADLADIVILLDMSGSMKHPVSPKEGEVTKLKGATDAIREFLTAVRKNNLPFNIAIIPFGYGCEYSYEVNSNVIKANLLSVNDNRLDQRLDALSQVPVCAATNLYNPLEETVQYLGDAQRVAEMEKQSQSDNIFIKWLTQSSEKYETSSRRLAVILLSDGFHVFQRETEKQQFETLSQILNSSVPIHTLGYGESLTTLLDRAKCPYSISDKQLKEDINFEKIRKCKLPSRIDITEFIVDHKRLTQIAELTGGIHLFPDNAQDVADSLKTFLTSLREYELIFNMPNADRGSTHEFTLTINDSQRSIGITSDSTKVTMDNFVYKSIPPIQRFSILFITIVFGGIGIFSFNSWSQQLKKQAKSFLVNKKHYK